MQRSGSDSGCGDTGGGDLVAGPCMVKQFRFSEVHSPNLTQSYFKSYEVSHAHTTISGLVHLFILSFVTSNETLRRTFRVVLGWQAEKGGCDSNLRDQDVHRLKHGEKGALDGAHCRTLAPTPSRCVWIWQLLAQAPCLYKENSMLLLVGWNVINVNHF